MVTDETWRQLEQIHEENADEENSNDIDIVPPDFIKMIAFPSGQRAVRRSPMVFAKCQSGVVL